MSDILSTLEVPSQQLMVDLSTSALFTPDIIKLERRENHLVFLYNECQSGLNRNWMAEYDGVYCGTMFTINQFTLFKQKDRESTRAIALLEKWPRIDKARLKGEVWAVSTEALKELDEYMLNGLEFQRYREDLIYPYTEFYLDSDRAVRRNPLKHSVHTAWMYAGIESYWNLHIDAGFRFGLCRRYKMQWNEVTTFDPNFTETFQIKEYYAFTQRELVD